MRVTNQKEEEKNVRIVCCWPIKKLLLIQTNEYNNKTNTKKKNETRKLWWRHSLSIAAHWLYRLAIQSVCMSSKPDISERFTLWTHRTFEKKKTKNLLPRHHFQHWKSFYIGQVIDLMESYVIQRRHRRLSFHFNISIINCTRLLFFPSFVSFCCCFVWVLIFVSFFLLRYIKNH